MTWFASLCKSFGLITPFLTGLGALLGLLFKVWQFQKGQKSPGRDGREMYQVPQIENPDLITVCSKLDAMESQQAMIMEMNSTLTEMVRSISTRLDGIDNRITNIDTRLTRIEERK